MKRFLATISLTIFVCGQPASAFMESMTMEDLDVKELAKAILVTRAFEITGINRVTVTQTTQSKTEKLELKTKTKTKTFGSVQLYLRQPILPENNMQPIPTVFLLAGVDSRLEYLDLIPEALKMNVVLLDYGLQPVEENVKSGKIVPLFFRSQMHIALAYQWLLSQPDIDAFQIVSMNVSFGTYIAPAALRLLLELGVAPAGTIFAFGGGSLATLLSSYLPSNVEFLADNPEIQNKLMREIKNASSKVGPEAFYGSLRGPFLIVEGTQDEIIPAQNIVELYSMLRGDKTWIKLDAPHINSNETDVVRQTMEKTVQWISKVTGSQL